MALTDELPSLGEDPNDLLKSLGLGFDEFKDQQSNIFSGLPEADLGDVPDGYPLIPRNEGDPNDAAVVEKNRNKAMEMAGNRNAAQRWGAQAQQPVPNVAQVQEANRVALDPRKGGSTSRYYTRQLARDILGNKHASADARNEARLALRFEGAPKTGQDRMAPPEAPVQPQGYGLSSEAQWQHLFPPRRETGETLPPQVTGGDWANIFGKSGTRANDFGAGTGAHKDERFNPVTGRMEIKPSLIQRIAEA